MGERTDYRNWTSEEEEFLKTHYGRDLSNQDLARRLGRTTQSVAVKAGRLGITYKKPRTSDAFLKFLKEKHAEGWSEMAIARAWGCGHQTVARHRQGLGLLSQEEKFATDNGWPADLRPREVQILNALWEIGPMTKTQIRRAAKISARCADRFFASLMQRGFIINLGRLPGKAGSKVGSKCIYSVPLWLERGEVRSE